MTQLTIIYGEHGKAHQVKVGDMIVGRAYRGTFRGTTGLWIKPKESHQLLLVQADIAPATALSSSYQPWTMYSNGEGEFFYSDQQFTRIEVRVTP